MGYHTDFGGDFAVTPALPPGRVAYLRKFSETRRMKRDAEKCSRMEDPARLAVGLPVGPEGVFFTGGLGFCGQDGDPSVLDHNRPAAGQPGLWCQWVPSDDGSSIAWDEGEKFYNYVEWLEYLITAFLAPWGHTLNGSVWWRGEEDEDRGTIHVKDNRVQAIEDVIQSPEPAWD